MNNVKYNNPKRSSRVSNDRIAYEYFRLIKNKHIDTVLNLFADDVLIYTWGLSQAFF